MSALLINWTGAFILLGLLARLSYIDWKSFRLPNIYTFPLIGVGLLYNFLLSSDLKPYLFGAGFGYAIFWSIETAYRLIRKRDGLGRGDAKLLAAGGAWCGAYALPFIVLIASSGGLIYILTKPEPERSQMKIPFGPFLAVAIAITFFALKFYFG